jgi:hypothetical protein
VAEILNFVSYLRKGKPVRLRWWQDLCTSSVEKRKGEGLLNWTSKKEVKLGLRTNVYNGPEIFFISEYPLVTSRRQINFATE